MKKKQLLFPALLIAALLLSACSAKSTDNYSMEEPDKMYMEESSAAQDTGGVTADNGAGSAAAGKQAAYGQKIIYTTDMYIETKEFEDSYSALLAAVEQADGYVAAKNLSGGYTSPSGYYSARSADLTLKIPAENYDAFLTEGASFGNVTSQRDTSEDITSSYIDTQARLDSLNAQKEQLMALLSKAQTVEDIITIQDKLSDVIYQIESYTATLKTYDDLVAYCTVTIYLEEVTTITVHTQTFGEELVEAIKGSGRSVVSFLREAVIVLIYVLPYLVILFLAFLLVRKLARTAKAKKAARADAPKPDPGSPFVSGGKDGEKK
ncbi:MAG: DUF4349 domain-containing protein [Oscillospiraceae bacterium]|nr:DUF4349 domain-containing protein [Oscillospiraceae bacterium]